MSDCQRDLFAIFDYLGCHTTDYKFRHIDRCANSRYNARSQLVYLGRVQFQYLRMKLHDIDRNND